MEPTDDHPTDIYSGPDRRRAHTGAFYAPPQPVEVQVDNSGWSWPRLLAQYGLGTLIVLWAMFWLTPRLLDRWDEHERNQKALIERVVSLGEKVQGDVHDLAGTARSIDEHIASPRRR